MSDPRKYRTREEEQQFETGDPIDKLADLLVERGEMSKDDVEALTKEVRTQVREALKWAEESPETPMEELYTDVYTEVFGPYKGTSLPQMLREGDGDKRDKSPQAKSGGSNNGERGQPRA